MILDSIHPSRKMVRGLILHGLLLLPFSSLAEWNVITHKDTDSNEETNIAYSINESGYSLEIYRDSVDAIRSRFTLTKGLLAFADKSCPTYQIDRGTPKNRSINDAPCLAGKQWAEFILGYIEVDEIASSALLSLMNGITITFRFQLANGDYRETGFSLQGSKRAMTIAFGHDIRITSSVVNP